MIVDGKAIAEAIQQNLKEEVGGRKSLPTGQAGPPVLSIVIVGENPVSERFLTIKKKFGEEIGVLVEEVRFAHGINENILIQNIERLVGKENRGVIVQLPLPDGFNASRIVNTIPLSHDPDMLGDQSIDLYREGKTKLVPPVMGAIKEVLFRHGIFVGNKKVVVMGHGALVGAPAALWFLRHGSNITIIDENTEDPEKHLLEADIIVLGVGKPGLLKPYMIRDGVVILDAGTSESGGKLLGDADPQCAQKASVFTPVPGGIGPITVAMLFKNLLELTVEPEEEE